jgi:hypothetical protein
MMDEPTDKQQMNLTTVQEEIQLYIRQLENWCRSSETGSLVDKLHLNCAGTSEVHEIVTVQVHGNCKKSLQFVRLCKS